MRSPSIPEDDTQARSNRSPAMDFTGYRQIAWIRIIVYKRVTFPKIQTHRFPELNR